VDLERGLCRLAACGVALTLATREVVAQLLRYDPSAMQRERLRRRAPHERIFVLRHRAQQRIASSRAAAV
jgi:hypothetical protein